MHHLINRYLSIELDFGKETENASMLSDVHGIMPVMAIKNAKKWSKDLKKLNFPFGFAWCNLYKQCPLWSSMDFPVNLLVPLVSSITQLKSSDAQTSYSYTINPCTLARLCDKAYDEVEFCPFLGGR